MYVWWEWAPGRGHPLPPRQPPKSPSAGAANLNEQKSSIYTTTAEAEQYVPGSPEVPPKLPEALLELLGVALEPPEAEPHARVQPEVGQLVLWPLEVGLWLPEVAAGQPGFAPGDSEVRPRGRS